VDSVVFYATAATVIPLLLIAVMATRSLMPGQLQRQPTSTVLIFGLPIVGEVAAFAFLFFEPMPAAAAVILSVLTWAGLLSQLGVAAWWLMDLVRSDTLALVRGRIRLCPMCGAPATGPGGLCKSCGADLTRSPEEAERADGDGSKTHTAPGALGLEGWLLERLTCPECKVPLRVDEDASELVCTSATCSLAYPVRNGIPILLVEEARRPGEQGRE
jgi:uncharacterized protein